MKLSTLAYSLTGCLLFAATSHAAFDLQVTEIYPGHSVQADVTADWFELTNYGDMAWVQGVDADLFYDDDSQDPGVADPLLGVSTILPGQSVVFVVGNAVDANDFAMAWSNLPDLVVGYTEGSGLSGGGDGVTIFSGTSNFPDEGISGETLLDFEAYPDYDLAVENGVVDGSTFDVTTQKFSRLNALAIASAAGGAFPIIGTPGSLVPEPTGLCLALAGLLAVGVGRTRS